MSEHKPISEEELKEMELDIACKERKGDYFDAELLRLISEVRKAREALAVYATPAMWGHVDHSGVEGWMFDGPPPATGEVGYQRAREALGWGPPAEPCDNPSCDGVMPKTDCPHPHRCFKDGRWLDSGEEM